MTTHFVENDQSVAEQMARNLTLTVQSIVALGNAAAALRVLPGPATAQAVIQTEHAWREMEDEFGLLDATQVGRLAGSRAKVARSWASQKHRDRQLLGISRRNRFVYPGFQLDSLGKIKTAIPAVLANFHHARWPEEHVALWFLSANGWLGGRRPVDVLDGDPEAVTQASVRATAEHW
jgi:hypothetical protein